MKPTEALPRARQPVARQHHPQHDGTIQKYIDSYSVTGLTSNPSIFDKAIGQATTTTQMAGAGLSAQDLFFELASSTRAGDLFLPVHERTDGERVGVAGGVRPLGLRHRRTVEAAKSLCGRAVDLFIKIPGPPRA